jgi:hypothetical protein
LKGRGYDLNERRKAFRKMPAATIFGTSEINFLGRRCHKPSGARLQGGKKPLAQIGGPDPCG